MKVFISLSDSVSLSKRNTVEQIAVKAIETIEDLFRDNKRYARKQYKQITNTEIEYTEKDGENVFTIAGWHGQGKYGDSKSLSYFVHSSKDHKKRLFKEIEANEEYMSAKEQQDVADNIIEYIKQHI